MTNGYRGPGAVKVTDPRNAVSGDRKKLKVLLRLGVYLYKYKWIVLLAIAMTVASNLFALIGPRLSGKAIDAIQFGKGAVDFETVFYYCGLMIVFYLDLRNPMMGFLVGVPFLVLAACTCISSIATGILLYADWRRIVKYRQKHAIK